MKKELFKATIRDVRYLKENGYLNKKGLDWADLILEEGEYANGGKDE